MSVNITNEQLRVLERNIAKSVIDFENDLYPDYSALISYDAATEDFKTDLSIKGVSKRISSLKRVAKTGNFEDLTYGNNREFKNNLNTDSYLALNKTKRLEDAKHGFMSGEDKFYIDNFFHNYGTVAIPSDIEVLKNRHNLVHRTDSGYRHIPSGGKTGDMLMHKADGDAVWEHHAIYSALENGGVIINSKDKDFEVSLNFTNKDEVINDSANGNFKNNGSNTNVARGDHVHDGRYIPAKPGSAAFNVTSNLIFKTPVTFENGIALKTILGDGKTDFNMIHMDSYGRLIFGDFKDSNGKRTGGAITLDTINDFSLSHIKGEKQYYLVTEENIGSQIVLGSNLLIPRDGEEIKKINGTLFDNSSDITTSKWGQARNMTIASHDLTGVSDAVSVNGEGNVTLKLPTIIKATLNGNASSATKLQYAREINGTAFDGERNITTNIWGTTRSLYIASHDGSGKGGKVNINGAAPSADNNNNTLLLPETIKGNLTGKATTAGTADASKTIRIDGVDRTATVEGNTLKFS